MQDKAPKFVDSVLDVSIALPMFVLSKRDKARTTAGEKKILEKVLTGLYMFRPCKAQWWQTESARSTSVAAVYLGQYKNQR